MIGWLIREWLRSTFRPTPIDLELYMAEYRAKCMLNIELMQAEIDAIKKKQVDIAHIILEENGNHQGTA